MIHFEFEDISSTPFGEESSLGEVHCNNGSKACNKAVKANAL
jgi:hypothetical protein